MPKETRTPSREEVTDPRQMALVKADGDFRKYLTPEFEAKAAAAASEEAEEQRQVKDKKPELGKVIKLPAKQPEDPILRLEQNMGCELPVCVSNRRQVNDIAITMRVDGSTTWRLERTAGSLLPAPEHYLFWLWALDRWQAAARAGCKLPPRLAIDPQELHRLFGGNLSGRWYENVHEAFYRFSHLVIEIHRAAHGPTKTRGMQATLGTLCYFVSRRSEGVEPEDLESFDWGWIAPGQMLWESILSGYVKAVPMQTLLSLPSYVAQRLTTYLMKHCRPGDIFKISLTKLLPKIPLDCPIKEAKKRLRTHHRSLLDAGFLAKEPVFEGRGENSMVIYERSRLGSS